MGREGREEGGEGNEREREVSEKGGGRRMARGHLNMDAFWRGHAAKTGFLKRPVPSFSMHESVDLPQFHFLKNVNIADSLGGFISGHLDIGNLILGALVGKYKLYITST